MIAFIVVFASVVGCGNITSVYLGGTPYPLAPTATASVEHFYDGAAACEAADRRGGEVYGITELGGMRKVVCEKTSTFKAVPKP